MIKNDISITKLEKLALTKNENSTYNIMSRYYGISNVNSKSMTTEEYKKNLNQIIGDN